MYEREEEQKTRDAIMIVGCRWGGMKKARMAELRVRNEIETHRITI